jgi:hypothetical protein
MKMSREVAGRIYDILEEIGARSDMRDIFVYSHITDEFQREWRFQGQLGFGGKFWNEYSYFDKKYEWRVSCYSEDENRKRLEIITAVNRKLKDLAQEIWQES